MKTFALIVVLFLAGCTSKPGTATLTAQQTLDAAVADERLAHLVAIAFAPVEDRKIADDAHAAFLSDVPIVQKQIDGGQLTPEQVITALAANYLVIKDLQAKAPKIAPKPATRPAK